MSIIIGLYIGLPVLGIKRINTTVSTHLSGLSVGESWISEVGENWISEYYTLFLHVKLEI